MTEQTTKDPWAMTLRELIEIAESWGGAAQLSALDGDGNPKALVCCVLCADQCREVGAVVEAMQTREGQNNG